MRKPFFRKSLQCWYVVGKDGKFIRLDPDEETAYKKWDEIRHVGVVVDASSVANLCMLWLQEHESLIEKSKFGQLAGYVANFAKSYGSRSSNSITKSDLMSWVSRKHPGRERFVRDKKGHKVLGDDDQPKRERGPSKQWSKTTQGDALHTIKRIFRWAHDEGKITRNPIAGLVVPQGEPRDVLITLEQHRLCLRESSPAFRAYLIASRCGARPRQIREVTAKNVITLPDGRMIWAFKEHKTDKSRRQLVVYLPACLATLTRIMMHHRRGRLFLNGDGNPWLKDTVSQYMRRLRKRVGIEGVTVYAYRHSFATDALMAGYSLAVVAELLGHKSTRMVDRVYGHLDQQKMHLLDAVQKTSEKRIQ